MVERKPRKGKKYDTPNGPMYQHHDVWIGPFDQWFVEKLSTGWGMDQNHVIGKIVEEYVAKETKLGDRLDFYKEVLLPNVLNKYGKKGDQNV